MSRSFTPKNNTLANFTWTYVGDTGKHYNVGLYHGERTGHILIYCNSRIVLIDFGVREPKTYPLFLDDELLEIKIEYHDNRFWYSLDINKEADTPRNRIRKERDRKDWQKTLMFFGGMVAMVLLFLAVMRLINPKPESINIERLLAEQGKESIGRVVSITAQQNVTRLKVAFPANDKVQHVEKDFQKKSPVILDHGMQLQEGDEFKVRYASERPDIFRLEFQEPTPGQINRYKERTLKKHLELNPSLSNERAECLIDIVYELKGIPGLADFFFQNQKSADNPFHNEYTYKRLIRDVPFLERSKARCP